MRRVLVIMVVAIVAAALAVSISGCALRVGLDTTVNDDGSGTISIRLAADKDLQAVLQTAGQELSGPLQEFIGSLREKLPPDVQTLFLMILGNIPTDWKVDRGTDPDGSAWINASRSFADPEELERILTTGPMSSFVGAGGLRITHSEGFFGTKTVFSGRADMGMAMAQAQAREPGLPQELLAGILTIENRVTLPGSIRGNNADEVNGNTLVWHLGILGGQEMYAESGRYNWGAIIGVAVAAAVGLALVVLIAVLLLRRRRRRARHEHEWQDVAGQPRLITGDGAQQSPPATEPDAAHAPTVQFVRLQQTVAQPPVTPAMGDMPESPAGDDQVPREGVDPQS
jgi:hypothetical protein